MLVRRLLPDRALPRAAKPAGGTSCSLVRGRRPDLGYEGLELTVSPSASLLGWPTNILSESRRRDVGPAGPRDRHFVSPELHCASGKRMLAHDSLLRLSQAAELTSGPPLGIR